MRLTFVRIDFYNGAMSTVAPAPLAPPHDRAVVDSEHLIDEHIDRTRWALKLVDFAGGLLTLAVALLAFLLVAALLDHWVVPGGLSTTGRTALFGAMVLGLASLLWRQFVPLLRAINPVFAAHTIEKTAPSLKNSLLNVLLFRTHREQMPAKVFYALEQQAAARLSAAPADATIDHAALLRLGYALVAIVAICAVYAVLSPKNLATSAGRVLAPWADIAAPSRVQIHDIKPGEASVAMGERVTISAEILGARDDDPVRLRYSTADGQQLDETVAMKRPSVAGRFSADLPRPGDASADGVQQDLEYWIEAGDARSRRFKLSVFQKPTIVVQRVHYQPPAYTGELSKTVDHVGDLRGVEGTAVVVEALASQPIKSAYVDFDSDGSNDGRMTFDGSHASVTFQLQLRPDRRTPWHLNYSLRFTTTEGRTNEEPAQYRIDVTPDYPPEIAITQPEQPELAVRADETVVIGVEGRDPDYALQQVRLMGRVRDQDVVLAELLTGAHSGRYRRQTRFVPADAQLKAGEVLEYWAEARDNRMPDANLAMSEHRRLRIVDPNAAGNPQQNPQGPGGGQAPNENGGASDQQGAADQQAGGGDQSQQQPGAQQESGEQSGEGQSGAGATASGQSGQSAEAQGQESQGAEGETQGGASSDSTEQGAQAGGSSAQPSTGQEGGAQTGGTSASDATSEQDASSTPSGQGDQSSGGGDANNPTSQGGAAGQSAPAEPVSSAGDDDGAAFERIRERLQEQDAASGGQSAEQQQAGGDAQAGEPASAGGESASGQSPDAAGGNNASDSGQSSGENSPSGDSAAPPSGMNPNGGDAGSGANAGESEGSPETSFKQPREKTGDDNREPAADDPTPPGGSRGKTESDSHGDQSGDRAGGGSEGAGQQADSAGQGDAGSHEPSDQGAGTSADQGPGEVGTEAGGQQVADGQTGQSSGDQRGAGSEQGSASGDQAHQAGGDEAGSAPTEGGGESGGDQPATGEQPGGDEQESGAQQSSDSQSGEPAAAGGQSGAEQPSEGQSAAGDQSGTSQGASGEAGDSSAGDSAGNPAGDNATPPADASQGGQTAGDSPSGDSSSTGNSSAGSAAPPTGGGTGASGGTGDGRMSEPGGDAANLDYARQQTDLVLRRIDDQLAHRQVDPELLKRLGWTEADLRAFIDRWKGLKAAAETASDDGKQQLDAALRSLGLRPTRPLGFRGAAAQDQLRNLNDSYRARAPLEYADRVRAYVKGAAAADDESR